LNVTQEQDGAIVIVALDGPVDSANSTAFRRALQGPCGTKGARVLIDCTNLTYMNSKGFGALTQHHRAMLATMGTLAICGLNRKLVKTMDLLGLGQMLRLFATREEALAMLKRIA
jgi:anti-sigma B factor antagonist